MITSIQDEYMFQSLASITRHFRLPHACAVCESPHRGPFTVCTHCEPLLKKNTYPCEICGLPLANETYPYCGECIQEKPAFDSTFAPLLYEEPLRTLIHQFKYHTGLYLKTYLAHLMNQALPSHFQNANCLIPVPLHPIRLKERGYNHTHELAKTLSHLTKIKLNAHICTKKRNTLPQAHLDHKTRQKNLHNAFAIRPHAYQHIILIDDVLTTGSTANELAHLFKKSGVKRVDVWCCARAAPKNHLPSH